jgi:hypothetical protein
MAGRYDIEGANLKLRILFIMNRAVPAASLASLATRSAYGPYVARAGERREHQAGRAARRADAAL